MDIKLETLRYHLVIFWRDFFTIDFYCKSGPFVIQNRYTSFNVISFVSSGKNVESLVFRSS